MIYTLVQGITSGLMVCACIAGGFGIYLVLMMSRFRDWF